MKKFFIIFYSSFLLLLTAFFSVIGASEAFSWIFGLPVWIGIFIWISILIFSIPIIIWLDEE